MLHFAAVHVPRISVAENDNNNSNKPNPLGPTLRLPFSLSAPHRVRAYSEGGAHETNSHYGPRFLKNVPYYCAFHGYHLGDQWGDPVYDAPGFSFWGGLKANDEDICKRYEKRAEQYGWIRYASHVLGRQGTIFFFPYRQRGYGSLFDELCPTFPHHPEFDLPFDFYDPPLTRREVVTLQREGIFWVINCGFLGWGAAYLYSAIGFHTPFRHALHCAAGALIGMQQAYLALSPHIHALPLTFSNLFG